MSSTQFRELMMRVFLQKPGDSKSSMLWHRSLSRDGQAAMCHQFQRKMRRRSYLIKREWSLLKKEDAYYRDL